MLVLFLSGFMLSCEENKFPVEQETIQHENILHFDVSYPLTSLNPTDMEASGSRNMFPLLYSYLAVPDFNGKLEPDLAIKWQYNPDNFAWTIDLRKDARFHNGAPVTSMDVKHSLQVGLKDNRPGLFSLIDRITILSETTIRIVLKKNDPDFLRKIWDMEIVTACEKQINHYDQSIGSGPFRFKSRKGEKEIVLEANEDYYLGRPSLDGVVFHFQPDKEASWARLLAGKTDIVQEISPTDYEMIRQYEKRFYFDLYPINHYAILLYNTNDPLFADQKVRRALSHAIDKDHIVKNLLKGFGTVAHGPMGVDSPYRNFEVQSIPYDPQKALKLLKEAGWVYDQTGRYLMKHGKVFEFIILVFEESQIEKKVAQYLLLSLNDLGIRVHVQSLSFQELKKRYFRNNDFHAVLTELISVGNVPEILKEIWFSDLPNKSAAGSFSHPNVTTLIRQALEEENPLKQQELLYEIDALIISLQPGIFLFHKTAIDAMSKRFKLSFPFSLTYKGIYRLRYASLSRE